MEESPFRKELYCGACKVHRLPVRSSAQPYSAEAFGEELGEMTLRVVTENFTAARVELRRRAEGELYATCPLVGKRYSSSVERSATSSRYFSLLVVSGDRKTYLGVSFRERSEAFDFAAALQEWDRRQNALPTKPVTLGPLSPIELPALGTERPKLTPPPVSSLAPGQRRGVQT
ncbi:hypothetical protein BASA81_000436 [Batrachochytrium salamandrivorans]|nr:hypothetical protein BASA81_000436 [Batrachochytrium salamandrivorans]